MIPAVKRGDAVAVSAGGEPPALFTSTSSAPKRSTVAAITASTWSGSRTSAATNSHPSGRSSGSWRQQIATCAPASAKRCAIPRPMPATAAGDEHDPPVEARQLGGIGHGGGVYDLTPHAPSDRPASEHEEPSARSRQARDDRRRRRRGPRRHDRRDRRLGIAPQADGARARAAALAGARPHDRLLRRARRRPAVPGGQGAPGRVRVRVARLDRARAALPQRAPGRRGRRRRSSTRACSCSGCRPRRGGCRSCRPASGSAPTSCASTPSSHGEVAVRRRRGARRDARARARRRADPHAPRRPGRHRPVPRRRSLLRRPLLHGRARRFMSVEQIVDTEDFLQGRPGAVDPHQPADDRRRGRDAARRALHRVRARLSRATKRSSGSTPRPRRPTRRGTSSGPSTST